MSLIPSPAEPRLASVRSSGGVYRSLEHWRGIAALSVVLFHAIGTEERTLHPLVELLKRPARWGWLGVHIFFVISGYCIAANVESLRIKGLGAFDFLRDRLCRILPTYWAAFGVTMLLTVVSGHFNHAPRADFFPATGWAWLGDLLLIQPYVGTKYYVIVYWTLVVELGFYFIVTLLYLVAGISARLAAAIALMLALAAVWVPPRDPWLVLACWPEFVCGLLVFHAVRADRGQESKRRFLCLGIIVLLGIIDTVTARYGPPLIQGPKQLTFSAVFALILYALYPLDDAIHRAPALRWVSFCGLFSFSLYLIHAPFEVRVYGIGRRFFTEQSPIFALLVLAACLVAITMSYIFYRVFEARFEVWRRRFKVRPISAA